MTPSEIRELAKDIDFAIDVTEPREVMLQRFEEAIEAALLRSKQKAQPETPEPWQGKEPTP